MGKTRKVKVLGRCLQSSPLLNTLGMGIPHATIGAFRVKVPARGLHQGILLLSKRRSGHNFNATLQLDTRAMVSRPAAVQVLDDFVPAPWSSMPSIFSKDFAKSLFSTTKQLVVTTVSAFRLHKKALGGWKGRTFATEVAESLYVRMNKSIVSGDKAEVKEIACPGAQSLIVSQLRAQQAVLQKLANHSNKSYTMEWAYVGVPQRPVVKSVRIASVMDDNTSFLAQVIVKHESTQRATIKLAKADLVVKENKVPVREYIVYEGYVTPNSPIDWKIAAKLNPYPLT